MYLQKDILTKKKSINLQLIKLKHIDIIRE